MSPLIRGSLVFFGGGLGASLRYWLGLWISGRTNPAFPWGTMTINITGSLAIGLVLGWIAGDPGLGGWRLFIAVGILGGYTTFSSFAWETLNLVREKSYVYSLGYFCTTCFAGLVACWLGLVIAHSLGRS